MSSVLVPVGRLGRSLILSFVVTCLCHCKGFGTLDRHTDRRITGLSLVSRGCAPSRIVPDLESSRIKWSFSPLRP